MSQLNNPHHVARSLIVYAIIVPIAIVVGYMLTDPLDIQSLGITSFVIAIMVFPLLMRWHYELLVFSWMANISVFFLPGTPSLWTIMVPISLTMSLLERILGRRREFVRAPQVIWPLLVFVGIVILTAELTGGFGLRALGSSVYGGRKYVNFFLGVASCFALMAREIPPEKAKKYLILFFLGASTRIVGDFYTIAPSWSNIIFAIFPPTAFEVGPFEVGVTRLQGVGAATSQCFILMLGLYGVRGILLGSKPWRLALLGLLFVCAMLGGFRIMIFTMVVIFALMFCLEKLHRTPLLPVFVLFGILGFVSIIPIADKLPFTFQRALAFLPLKLDPAARVSAQESTDWRVKMWDALLPQVPDHLLLGKGYAFSAEEYSEMMERNSPFAHREFDAAQDPLAVAGDYHNGMLSIVLVFGIWGVVVFVWFAFVGIHATYANYKHGPPELRTVNALLFCLFFYQCGLYFSCWSGMSIGTDLPIFTGYLGLSLAINHGIRHTQRKIIAARPQTERYVPQPHPSI